MDIVTKGYLDRFADDFGISKKDYSIVFENFCHYSILKNDLSFLDGNDLQEVSTGKNKGIDGICISVDGTIITTLNQVEDIIAQKRSFDVDIYFFQAKTSPSFTNAQIANFCDTVIDFLSEDPEYDFASEVLKYHEIYLEILKALSYLKSFNCKLYYCTTGTWNNDSTCAATIKKKKAELKKTGYFKNISGDEIEITPIDREHLIRLFDKANQPLNAEFTFSQKTPLSNIRKIEESYIGVLPFKEYMKVIVDSDSGKLKPLFYDNVRDFLGEDQAVNDKIQQTLADKEFDIFQLLNNGITVVAEENKGRADKFILINSQVANGCQTSNVLYINRDLPEIDKLFIPIKLIITKDPDIRDRIIVSSNNQTEIKEEQLLALTSFQKGLEDFYKHNEDGLYYERRKAQYSYDSSIKKKVIVDIREQIKAYVAIFLEEPHVVSGYFGKVYRDRKDTIFKKDHKFDPYYLSGLIQFVLKKYLGNKIDKKYNKARYHFCMLFRKIAEPSEKPFPSENRNETYCSAILKIIRDEKKCLKNFEAAIEIFDATGIDISDQKEIYKKSTTNTLIEEFNKRYK